MILDFLSPSKIHFINDCKFRYVSSITQGSNSGLKVFNSSSFLGVLMHSVLEKYVKRQYSRDEYEGLWNELMIKMLREYQIDIANIDNIKYHLPYYEIKKNKLYQLLESYNFNVTEYNLSIEKKLIGGVVKGTADIVFDNPLEKKVKIIDFKTGPIASYENAKRHKLKAGYKLQLLTYGYIYWLSGYRAENIICGLQGISICEYEEIIFSNEEYQRHEVFLKNLKKIVNNALRIQHPEILAKPNPKICMNCDNHMNCKPLHNEIKAGVNYPTLSLLNPDNSEFNDIDLGIKIIKPATRTMIKRIPINVYNSMKNIIANDGFVFISGLFEEDSVNVKYWTSHSTHFELLRDQ